LEPSWESTWSSTFTVMSSASFDKDGNNMATAHYCTPCVSVYAFVDFVVDCSGRMTTTTTTTEYCSNSVGPRSKCQLSFLSFFFQILYHGGIDPLTCAKVESASQSEHPSIDISTSHRYVVTWKWRSLTNGFDGIRGTSTCTELFVFSRNLEDKWFY
jgi:hypothetical protein